MATCAASARCGCSTNGAGATTPAASAPSRSKIRSRRRVRGAPQGHAGGDQEGDHGPAPGRRVGNIYANEALFEAGIDPSKPTNKLSLDEFARLHAAVTGVLERAVESSGTTVRDYRTGTASKAGSSSSSRCTAAAASRA